MPDAFKIFYFISKIFDFTMIIWLKFDLKEKKEEEMYQPMKRILTKMS